METTDMIRAVQKALGVTIDGNAGPQTWTAIYAARAPGCWSTTCSESVRC